MLFEKHADVKAAAIILSQTVAVAVPDLRLCAVDNFFAPFQLGRGHQHILVGQQRVGKPTGGQIVLPAVSAARIREKIGLNAKARYILPAAHEALRRVIELPGQLFFRPGGGIRHLSAADAGRLRVGKGGGQPFQIAFIRRQSVLGQKAHHITTAGQKRLMP